MKRIVCAVRDSASELFGQPIFVPGRGLAVRGLEDEVNRSAPPQENPVFHHPEQFTLYELGTFDDVTGRLESCQEGPIQMVRAVDLKKS